MKTKTILSCFASIFFLFSHADAQKKEATSVKVEIKQDSVVNYRASKVNNPRFSNS